MTVSELKYKVEESGHLPYFFSRETMKFFGDTMHNYGVYSTTIKNSDNENIECWALHRKKPVKHRIQTTAYFNKKTFNTEFPQ